MKITLDTSAKIVLLHGNSSINLDKLYAIIEILDEPSLEYWEIQKNSCNENCTCKKSYALKNSENLPSIY